MGDFMRSEEEIRKEIERLGFWAGNLSIDDLRNRDAKICALKWVLNEKED